MALCAVLWYAVLWRGVRTAPRAPCSRLLRPSLPSHMVQGKGGDVHAAYAEMGQKGGESRKDQMAEVSLA